MAVETAAETVEAIAEAEADAVDADVDAADVLAAVAVADVTAAGMAEAEDTNRFTRQLE